MARAIKELPKLFYSVWEEFQQRQNMFWASRRTPDGIKLKTPENLALMYLMKKKLRDDLEEDLIKLETELLQAHEDKDWNILLPEFGKVVLYDKDAMMIFIDDMNASDYKKFDEESNKKYLEKHGG